VTSPLYSQQLGTATTVPLYDGSAAGQRAQAVDIYSLAMVIWEIFHAPRTLVDALRGATSKALNSPLSTITRDLMMAQVKNGCRPLIDSTHTPKLKALLDDMWQNDPSLRPSISQVAARLFHFQSSEVSFGSMFFQTFTS
jgi:hypothetical protein